jgi:hypothetical protein
MTLPLPTRTPFPITACETVEPSSMTAPSQMYESEMVHDGWITTSRPMMDDRIEVEEWI